MRLFQLKHIYLFLVVLYFAPCLASNERILLCLDNGEAKHFYVDELALVSRTNVSGVGHRFSAIFLKDLAPNKGTVHFIRESAQEVVDLIQDKVGDTFMKAHDGIFLNEGYFKQIGVIATHNYIHYKETPVSRLALDQWMNRRFADSIQKNGGLDEIIKSDKLRKALADAVESDIKSRVGKRNAIIILEDGTEIRLSTREAPKFIEKFKATGKAPIKSKMLRVLKFLF